VWLPGASVSSENVASRSWTLPTRTSTGSSLCHESSVNLALKFRAEMIFCPFGPGMKIAARNFFSATDLICVD
jgi:hypothetical protein